MDNRSRWPVETFGMRLCSEGSRNQSGDYACQPRRTPGGTFRRKTHRRGQDVRSLSKGKGTSPSAIRRNGTGLGPFETVTMDFITGLPPSLWRGKVYDAVMVLVDPLTK